MDTLSEKKRAQNNFPFEPLSNPSSHSIILHQKERLTVGMSGRNVPAKMPPEMGSSRSLDWIDKSMNERKTGYSREAVSCTADRIISNDIGRMYAGKLIWRKE